MWDILSWLFFIVFIAGLIVAGGLLLKGYAAQNPNSGAFGGSFGKGLFGNKTEKRLDVVDQANVDGRRRLVLVRRDDVEHLIMTGGPVDVVIETGIEGAKVDTSRATQRLVKPISTDPDGADADRGPTLVARTPRSFSKTAAGDG